MGSLVKCIYVGLQRLCIKKKMEERGGEGFCY